MKDITSVRFITPYPTFRFVKSLFPLHAGEKVKSPAKYFLTNIPPMGIYTPRRYFMEKEDRKKIVNRLKRIEGQIRGLERLVENGAPCLDVLTQVSAVTAAVKKTGAEVIRVSLEQCLAEASTKQKTDLRVKKDEFQKALSRYIDMA